MSRSTRSLRPLDPDVHVRVDGPFAAGFVPWQRRAGETVLTVVVKATYALESELCPLLDEPESLQDIDGFWDDDTKRSLHAPSDMALMKPGAEVIVVGHAYAKEGRPAPSIISRLAIGSIDKMLETCPQRRFDREGHLTGGPPAARMPLHYEAAAGGSGTDNPVGIDPTDFAEGGSRRVPGVLPANLDVRPGEHIPTIGFGPIAPHWPPRARLLRPQDEAWLRSPLERPMPQGFDARFFLVAPADQRAIEPFRSDERLILEGLSKHHTRLVTNLAGVAPMVSVVGASLPMPALSADLLCIDTDRGIATLTFRGHVAFEGAMPPLTLVISTKGDRESASAVHSIPVSLSASSSSSSIPSSVSDATAELPRHEISRSAARIAAAKSAEALLETTHVESDPEVVRAAVLPFSPMQDVRSRLPNAPDPALPFRGAPAEPQPPSGRASLEDSSVRRSDSGPPPSSKLSAPPLPPPSMSSSSMSSSSMSSSSMSSPSMPSSSVSSSLAALPSASATPPPPAVVPPAPVVPPPLPSRPGASAPPPVPSKPGSAMPPLRPAASSPSALPAPPPLGASLQAMPAPPPLGASIGAIAPPASVAPIAPMAPARASTVGERMGSAFATGDALSSAKRESPLPPPVRVSDPIGSTSEPSRPRDAFQMAFGRSAGARDADAGPKSSVFDASKLDGVKSGPYDSAKDASDAALRAERQRESAQKSQRAEPSEVIQVKRRALVDLLAFDPTLPRRLRRAKAFNEVLSDFSPPRVPRRPDEVESDRDRDERGRLEVLRVLSCGLPVDTNELGNAIDRSLDDPNDLELPLFLVAGELRPTFDEVEALRAALAVAQPLAGSDKRMAAAVGVATDALAAPSPPLRQTAVALYRQLETATNQLSLPPRYLAEQVEHALLTNRRYRKPTILGEPRIRAELASGSGAAYPAYLSESLALRLPMLTSFSVVALVELHPREDAGETSVEALLVTAIARVVRTVRPSR